MRKNNNPERDSENVQKFMSKNQQRNNTQTQTFFFQRKLRLYQSFYMSFHIVPLSCLILRCKCVTVEQLLRLEVKKNYSLVEL